jgi:hypothetical protein
MSGRLPSFRTDRGDGPSLRGHRQSSNGRRHWCIRGLATSTELTEQRDELLDAMTRSAPLTRVEHVAHRIAKQVRSEYNETDR